MHSLRTYCVLPLLLGTLLVLVAGCGGPKVVPIEGKLKLSDGKTLPAGTLIILNPAEGHTGTASGKTDADGSFTLTHASGAKGAEVGKYSVVLHPPQGQDKEFYKLITRETAESAISVEIKEGEKTLEITIPKR